MPPEQRKKRKARRAWVDGLRWGVAVLAMLATWGYGIWKGGSVMWLCFPAGGIVLACMAAALTIPVITSAVVAVAVIQGIDNGITTSIRNAAGTIVLIGLAVVGWRLANNLRERDRRR